jgi:predicted nucleic acid-binding protein
MEKQPASLDASFWIGAHKVDLVSFLPEYFNLFVCQAVADEIRYPLEVLGIPAASSTLFDEWCQTRRITLQEPKAPVHWFQRGENYAAALALEHGYWLLIDDNAAYHFAKSRGIEVVGTMDFTVFLYEQGRLSYQTAMSTLRSLDAAVSLARKAMITLETLARMKGDKKDVE